MVDGKAFDHSMTRRTMTISRLIACISPSFFANMMGNMLLKAQKKAFPQLLGHPSFSPDRQLEPASNRIPVFSADLAENLVNGTAQAVTGIAQISGPRSVTLTDGTILEDIDAIIVCSGYSYDFSLIPAAANPSNPDFAPDHFTRFKSAPFYSPNMTPFARLYRGFVSEVYPDSLAFLGHVLIMKPGFPLYDLITMALASLWTGGYPLPSPREMNKDINGHYDYVVSLLHKAPLPHPGFRLNGRATYLWLNEVAGTGVNERLASCRWPAWKLWWQDRVFYNLLMGGIDSPHVYRLFDTGRGRKPWSGARRAIEEANEDVKRMEKTWKEEQEKLKN
jgi:dimethylaniline monooxygenase (N-oxide forming)